MLPGVNPRQMQQMMRKMGMKQEEIPAIEVIIRTPEKEIIIQEPSVQKINMMGQENFQISGNIVEKELSSEPDINEEDIQTVMSQANVDKETALKTIEECNGDLAEAIMKLASESSDEE